MMAATSHAGHRDLAGRYRGVTASAGPPLHPPAGMDLARARRGIAGIATGGRRLLLLSLFAGLSLCQSARAQSARVAIGITNTATDAAFFIADKKGYFRAEGIEVAMTPFASAAGMIAPLGRGQLDVGGGTVAAGLYNAVANGINLRIVADKGSVTDKLEYSTLLIRKDLVDGGRYKTLRDLKGMTVAAASPGSGSESSLNEALKKGGLKFTDVNVVYMGFPDMLVTFRNKGIDAGVTNEPTVTRALREGAAVRASPDVIYPGQQTAVVLFSEDFARQRRPIAQKFLLAYIRAARDYNDALLDGKLAGANAAEIISILNGYTEIKDPETYATMNAFAVNPNGAVNAESLKNDYNFFTERGLIPSKVAVEQVIDKSFAEEAVRILGPYRAR
jgi:NitT/TauT family transport system substrate-binding protein